MATNYGATVNAIYLAYYGRPADPAGLAFWTDSLQKTNGDLNAIVNAFATSPEATVRFASVSVTDRVADIYQQLFNRAPDKAGLDYWVAAIESGRLSIANAAIEIMHGAVSTDAQISTVRQQVAAQFTAEVEKSGIAYDGIAAVQAARVLISAVTADSKPADIDALVKAGSSLVQTAHDNPAVITALANGGDLSKVLGTASGQADPVGMVQALASIGKAALTDSAGLEALLQGGGVSGLLNSLPSGTSLADVAAAVKDGGLAAGADVAKPPADTTPPPAPTVQLAQDTGASATDHVTSNGKIQVKGIESGAAWQYSTDGGKTWTAGAAADANGAATLDTTANGEQTLQVRVIDTAGNIGAATSFQYTLRTSLAPTMIFTVDGKEMPGLDTLSVNSINYLVHIFGTTKGSVFDFQVSDSGKDGSWTTVKDTDPLSEGSHYIRYVATDLAGNVGATNALKLVWDQTAPSAPKVELVKDSGVSSTDHITNDGHIKVSGLEASGSWEYSLDAGQTWTSGPAANADGIAILETTANGLQSLQVRSHDLARNTSEVSTFDYTLRTSLAPTMIFTVDGKEMPGLDTLSVNSIDYLVHIFGTTKGSVFDFQVSDTGADGSWTTVKDTDPLTEGTHYIRYVATDLAGNIGATNALKLVWDQTPPAAPKVELVKDSGVSATDRFTNDGHVKVSGLEASGSWEYSLDAGQTWTAGPAANADGIAILETTANGLQSLQVRSHDLARNTSEVSTFDYTLRTSLTPTMIFTVDGKEMPGLDTLSVNSIDYLVHIFGTTKGSVFDFQVSDTGADGSWITVKDTDPLSEGTHYIRYVATDLAGNIGATNALKLVWDQTPPAAPKVDLVKDSGISATDRFTNDGHVKVSGLEANGSWEYSFDAGKTWTTGPAANADGVAILETTANGPQSLQVRSHDLARNTSEVVKFDYTLQSTFNPSLAFRDGAYGADLPGTTLLTNTDDYWVTLHGGLNAAKVVFQLSGSGLDGSWADADPSAPLADGTYYIRDIVTDRAGNVGTTNALRVDMDKTAPAAPKVELVKDSGVSATDRFTNDGHVKVSGLEASGSWEYSLDAGKTWTGGPAANADGVAILATTANGPQSLQVRSHDAAHNTSAVTTFDFTLQSTFNPTLAFRDGAYGADLPGTTLLTNTDDFWITLHGGLNAAKVVYQVSDTGLDGTWADADMSAPLPDGTHYIRDIVTDRAGNVGTTNALRVDMDKTAPGAPKVELVQDTGTSATDGLTTWPEYRVSGIEAGASWEYSLDAGKTWLKGAALDANGVATGVLPASGDQTLLFRATDKAGNVSSTTTLHANYDNVVPAENLAFDHITGGAKGVSETTLTKVDAVYTYTGTLKAGAVVEYTFGGNIWTKVDASMIDTAARTITIKDIDLSAGDKYVDLHVSDAAGWTTVTGYQFIDGPVTKFTTQVTDSGVVIYSDQGANAYLTSNGTPVRILSAETGGIIISDIGTAVGVQASGVSGVLGVGRSAAVHSDGDVAYGFGSNGSDTLAGKFVWGYAGNDDITTVGSGGTVIGGAGADTIHVNSGSSKLVIHGVSESQVVADATTAHGFDTVTTNPTGLGSATITLSFAFDAAIKDGYQAVTAASYTGAETGVELLALLNGAVASSFQASGNGQAMMVKTGTDASFLVVDANGDAKIDAADYVVKIVGSVDTSGMSFGAGTVYLPVPVI